MTTTKTTARRDPRAGNADLARFRARSTRWEQDGRLGPLLTLDKVGVYGFSAGGHTALSLAGGRWSPARFRHHCESHISEDFQACVGLASQLNGNLLDGLKTTIALWVIRHRFRDAAWQTHTDPRIAVIVAGCPYAADFDMASLAAPRVPLALVTAPRDKWLIPLRRALIATCCRTWIARLRRTSASTSSPTIERPMCRRISGMHLYSPTRIRCPRLALLAPAGDRER